jgi:hypothetical protein
MDVTCGWFVHADPAITACTVTSKTEEIEFRFLENTFSVTNDTRCVCVRVRVHVPRVSASVGRQVSERGGSCVHQHYPCVAVHKSQSQAIHQLRCTAVRYHARVVVRSSVGKLCAVFDALEPTAVHVVFGQQTRFRVATCSAHRSGIATLTRVF